MVAKTVGVVIAYARVSVGNQSGLIEASLTSGSVAGQTPIQL